MVFSNILLLQVSEFYTFFRKIAIWAHCASIPVSRIFLGGAWVVHLIIGSYMHIQKKGKIIFKLGYKNNFKTARKAKVDGTSDVETTYIKSSQKHNKINNY